MKTTCPLLDRRGACLVAISIIYTLCNGTANLAVFNQLMDFGETAEPQRPSPGAHSSELSWGMRVRDYWDTITCTQHEGVAYVAERNPVVDR